MSHSVILIIVKVIGVCQLVLTCFFSMCGAGDRRMWLHAGIPGCSRSRSSKETLHWLVFSCHQTECLYVKINQGFEHLQENNHTSSEVELKVLLPDRSLCVVKINRNDTADEVFKVKMVLLMIMVMDIYYSTTRI